MAGNFRFHGGIIVHLLAIADPPYVHPPDTQALLNVDQDEVVSAYTQTMEKSE